MRPKVRDREARDSKYEGALLPGKLFAADLKVEGPRGKEHGQPLRLRGVPADRHHGSRTQS